MSKTTLGDKIRSIRKKLNLNQLEFATKLGFKSATAISKYEDNSREPDKNKLIEIAKMGNITLDELMLGTVPENYPEHINDHSLANKKSVLYSRRDTFADPPRHPAAVLMPIPDLSVPPGIDPAVQAMSDIKEIFDSGDPILIPAIQANLHAFKRALQRERQFAQVIEENKDLKNRMSALEMLCKEIPNLKTQFETLQTENQALRTENSKLRDQNGGFAPINLSPDNAALTGTDDKKT